MLGWVDFSAHFLYLNFLNLAFYLAFPEVIKNDRYKSAEIAYMEIQKYCKVKGYMFSPDMTEEEFVEVFNFENME